MHGELMEFNELLQKQLLYRESLLKHLTEELVSLRGPVSTYLQHNARFMCFFIFCVCSVCHVDFLFDYGMCESLAFIERAAASNSPGYL